MMKSIKFRNACIYSTSKRHFFNGGFTIDNGIIVSIYSDDGNDNDIVDAIDLEGLYVIPGLVDVHTHGRIGFDFVGATESDIARMAHSYAEKGSTTVFPTIVTSPLEDMKKSIETIKYFKSQKNTDEFTSNFDGIHIEGRYINEKRPGCHNISLLMPLDTVELIDFINQIIPLQSHFTLAPELKNGEIFVKTAVRLGSTVAIGHSDSTDEEAYEALKWGANSFTHLFNAMRPLHHREPGTVGAGLSSDAYTEVVCDGFHIHPNVVKLAYRAKEKDKFVLVTDSMAAAGKADGFYRMGGIKVNVIDGKATTDDGVIAGSTLDLYTAVNNLMKFCDISLEEAIPCATINPAKMVGVDSTTGSIEVGKRADFIVLDKDKITIKNVYSNGIALNK